MDANLKEMREEIKSGQAEMISTVNAFQETTDVWIANMRDDRKERMGRQEATEANPEEMEPHPEKMGSGAEHREFPKELLEQ
jgi:hypothetical protein